MPHSSRSMAILTGGLLAVMLSSGLLITTTAYADAAYWQRDCDGDGHPESLIIDVNGDLNPEYLFIDLDGVPTTYEVMWGFRISLRRLDLTSNDRLGRVDTDDDGVFDQAWVDTNRNMRASRDEWQPLLAPEPVQLPPICAKAS